MRSEKEENGEKHREHIVEPIESSADYKDPIPRFPDVKFETKDIEHLTKKFSQPPELNEKGERKMVCPFPKGFGGKKPEVKAEDEKNPNDLGDDDSLKEDEELKAKKPEEPQAKKNAGFESYKKKFTEFAMEKRTLIGVAAVSALAIGGFLLRKRKR